MMSNQSNLETDPRFPSGPWTGYFLQRLVPGRHLMELGLTFRQGEMTGEGRDWVGEFIVRGRYDLADGRCHFTKRYLAKHDVFYQGFNEGKGIWGTWEITASADQSYQKGGFHIWPEGMPDPTASSLSEAADLPMLLEEMPELKPSEVAPTGERILKLCEGRRMPTTLTIRDESTGGPPYELVIELLTERITVRELIRSRVYQEVMDYNQRQPEVFRGLVAPDDAERTLNGYRLSPRQLGWKRPFEQALRAFEAGRFFILVGERQVESLDDEIVLEPGTEVSFVKLTPLTGG